MEFIKDFWIGIKSYFEGILIVFQYNLWIFLLIPTALFFGIYYGGEWMLHELQGVNLPHELEKIDFQQELTKISFQGFPSNMEELKLMVIGFQLIFVILASKLNKYLVLILLSPMNTLVATRTEYVLSGNVYKFSFQQFVSDVFRGVNFALRNLFTQFLVVLVWIVLTYVFPFLNNFTFWVMFVIGSYFYGASLLDYTLEKRKISMEKSYAFIFKNAGITLSIGLLFSSLFFVSFGILLAPLTGVVAGTLALHKKYDLKKKFISP
jgi:CysZ protein